MRKPQQRLITLVALVLLISMLSLAIGVPARTQTPAASSSTSDLQSGIALYQSGDFNAAIKVLQRAAKREKDELCAQHYLGLAFEHLGKTRDAAKAHENAGKLGAALLEAQLLDIGLGNSNSLRPDIHEALTQAAESAGRYLTLKPQLSKSKQEEWKARAEDLGYYAERTNPKNATKRPPQTFSSKGVDTKVRVLHKPEAMYTEEARRRGVTGTIVLSAVFTADGKVRDIRAIKALPEGLTLMAINAARRIRFMPAMKDGKPVSMFMQLEYNFNLY